jgi:hypothetical protein
MKVQFVLVTSPYNWHNSFTSTAVITTTTTTTTTLLSILTASIPYMAKPW